MEAFLVNELREADNPGFDNIGMLRIELEHSLFAEHLDSDFSRKNIFLNVINNTSTKCTT